MRNMRIVMMAAVVMALPGLAHAGKKPSTAEAKKAATAWLAAASADSPTADALVAVTALPFLSAAYEVPDASCAWSTVAKPAGLADAIACVSGHISEHTAKSKLKPWKAKDLSGVAFADHDKETAAVAKDATLVALSPGDCYSNADDLVVFAVIKDDKGAVKVSAVVVENDLCGE
jgi:hypothetical protein